MIPESIRAEIEAKGGLSGAPEPQGNGTTIYRAASGDYVVVDDASGQPRMRGFAAPAGQETQTAPAVPPATVPVVAPGAGTMNQQQLEELLRQVAPNNDPSRLVFSEGVRKRQKPADAFGAGGEVQTRWVRWVDPGTGRVLEADIEADGSYTVTKNAVERGEQGAPATSASQAGGVQEGDTRGPQGGKTREVYRGGQWVVEANPLYQPPEPAKPGAPTLKPDGKGGTVAVQTLPDGTIKTTPLPGVPSDKPQPARVTVNGTVYEKDPQSGVYAPAAGLPTETDKDAFGVEPEGAPPMQYTVGQMSAGLRTYSQWLSQQVKLHKDTNGQQGVAPAEATKLMERRIALAESTLKEQEGLVNAQSGQRGQDITQRSQTLSETQSRRGTAERIGTNALSTFVPLATKLGPGGGALLSRAIADTLTGARGYVDSFGGLRESPEIAADSFPALAEIRRASMAGINTAAAGGPQIFDARNPPTAPPGPALGPPPAALATPPADPMAAEAAAQAAIEAANAGRPAAPMVPVANNPIDNSPIVAPGQLPGAAPNLSPAVVNATTGTTRGLIDSVLQQPAPAPAPVDPNVGQPGDPQWQLPPNEVTMAPRTPPMRAMQEARYGQGNYFDPEMAGNELAMRLGIDPAIMGQAISSLYG